MVDLKVFNTVFYHSNSIIFLQFQQFHCAVSISTNKTGRHDTRYMIHTIPQIILVVFNIYDNIKILRQYRVLCVLATLTTIFIFPGMRRSAAAGGI